jgi:hypothetical protein
MRTVEYLNFVRIVTIDKREKGTVSLRGEPKTYQTGVLCPVAVARDDGIDLIWIE